VGLYSPVKTGIHLDIKMITVAWMWTKIKQRIPGFKTSTERAPLLEEKHDNQQS
jgi:hypothetical protein